MPIGLTLSATSFQHGIRYQPSQYSWVSLVPMPTTLDRESTLSIPQHKPQRLQNCRINLLQTATSIRVAVSLNGRTSGGKLVIKTFTTKEVLLQVVDLIQTRRLTKSIGELSISIAQYAQPILPTPQWRFRLLRCPSPNLPRWHQPLPPRIVSQQWHPRLVSQQWHP